MAAGLVLLVGSGVFYFAWSDKVSAVLVFLVSLLWLTRVPFTQRLAQTVARIGLYVLFPYVYLLSEVEPLASRLIVTGLYLPIVFKLVPGIIESVRLRAKEESRELAGEAYTNLIYLYFSPVVLLQEARVAYAVLGVYALVYVFGWEKYILRPIPLWERVVHLIGLSSVLLLVSYAL